MKILSKIENDSNISINNNDKMLFDSDKSLKLFNNDKNKSKFRNKLSLFYLNKELLNLIKKFMFMYISIFITITLLTLFILPLYLIDSNNLWSFF